jgi:TfoX/Sxy family transcriptional regulator of competence genes
MAYDEELAERIRSVITVRDGVTERKMFGGVAWMVHGNMACGVLGEDMIVRLEESDAEQALTEPGVRPFDFTGRPMRSTLFVGPEATADDAALSRWVDAGADHAASLPPK